MTEMTTRLRLPAAGLALLIGLAACGSPASPGPSGSATPSVSAAPASAAPSLAPTPEPSLPPSAEPTGSPVVATYTVQAGDTLYSIARSWGTTVAQLQAWNGERYTALAEDPDVLEAGWILVVAGDPRATPLPTPRVTPAPTPAPSGCRAGNRVAPGAQQTFGRIQGAGRAVALTFDMGGRLEPGVAILNLLIARGICATIFPTGAMADTPQGREVMAIIKAHPELFEIGNHTMHHCDLVRGGGGSPTTAPCAGVTPTSDFIRRQLTDAAAILERLSGQSPVPYWRPPYGSVNDAVRSAAAAAGYTKTFMWDIDTIDWKPISEGGPTANQIASTVITRAQDGSIVLMHLGGYETLAALRIMIRGLRDRGFQLTSLSDMLS